MGPFEIGEPLVALAVRFSLTSLDRTGSDRHAGTTPYAVDDENGEVVQIDVKLGLIEAVTTYSSFCMDGVELIGCDAGVLNDLLGEIPIDTTEVEHEDGSVVTYLDYSKGRLIVSTESGRIASVCIF